VRIEAGDRGAARRAGVKPIIGADLWLEPEGGEKSASRLLVLAKDTQGYLHLCELISRSWLNNAQRTQAWVKWEWLSELGAGLIALSGAEYGAVGQALMTGDAPRAQALARKLGLAPAPAPSPSAVDERVRAEAARQTAVAKDLHLDICSNCHPFFTGKQKLIDTEGRVDKFRKKYNKA